MEMSTRHYLTLHLKDKTHTGNLKVNLEGAQGIEPTLKTDDPSVNISLKKG